MSPITAKLAILALVGAALAAPVTPHKGYAVVECPDSDGADGHYRHRLCMHQQSGPATSSGQMEALSGPITAVKYETDYTTVTSTITVTLSPLPDAASTAATTSSSSSAAASSSSSSSSSSSVASSSSTGAPAPSPNMADEADVKPAVTTAPTSTSTPPPPPATSSTQSPPASSGSGGAPSGGKRGISYNGVQYTTAFEGTKVSWAYNWGQTSGGLSSNYNYVPMLWGLRSDSTSSWEANAKAAIAAGSDCLLGFNEPDMTSQSNIDPASAAAGYKTYMNDMFGGGSVRLGAPAVTNGAAPMGLAWLSSFMEACTDCQIDFVPIHWYDSASNAQYFQNYVQQAHQQTGKPIWITEFGATGSDAEISSFFETVLPWLDAQPYVERYSYFMAADGMLNSGTALSSYGNTYATC